MGSKYLCPKCQELLSETLECMFCGGHYEWVERKESSDKFALPKSEDKR